MLAQDEILERLNIGFITCDITSELGTSGSQQDVSVLLIVLCCRFNVYWKGRLASVDEELLMNMPALGVGSRFALNYNMRTRARLLRRLNFRYKLFVVNISKGFEMADLQAAASALPFAEVMAQGLRRCLFYVTTQTFVG